MARRLFSEKGYDATTVRAIAAEAGVAPNLVTRYFGGKAGLYREASDISLDVPALLPGPIEQLGQRIAAKVVRRWEGAGGDDPLLMMLRAAGSSDEAAAATGKFFAVEAAKPLAAHLERELGLGPSEAADRAAGVGALIAGVVMQRYVMRTGPIAAAPGDALERWLAGHLQHLLLCAAPPLGSRRLSRRPT